MEVNASTLHLHLEPPTLEPASTLRALRVDAYLRKTACFCYTTRNLVVGG